MVTITEQEYRELIETSAKFKMLIATIAEAHIDVVQEFLTANGYDVYLEGYTE